MAALWPHSSRLGIRRKNKRDLAGPPRDRCAADTPAHHPGGTNAVDLARTSPTPTVALRGYRIAPGGGLTPEAGEAAGNGLLFSAASLLVVGR